MTLLKEYMDVFTWTYDEMPGLDPGLVVHAFNVDLGVKPVIQLARVFHTDVETQITLEVKKLQQLVLSSPFNILNGFPT